MYHDRKWKDGPGKIETDGVFVLQDQQGTSRVHTKCHGRLIWSASQQLI
jgi:hypothetical protein